MLRKTTIHPNLKADSCNQKPVIIQVIEFSEKGYKDFATAFQEAVTSGQDVIPIHIDSFGGQVYALLGMLELIKTSPVPVATYVATKAMSCGSVLLSAGTDGYRFIAPNATVLVHQVSSGAWGKVEDLEVTTSHVTSLNKRLMGILSKNCGHDANYFTKRLHENGNADLYYTAREAVEHGIVNHVKTPVMTVELIQKVSLQ